MLTRLPADGIYAKIASPVGDLTVIASSAGLHAVLWQVSWCNKENATILNALPQDPEHQFVNLCKVQFNEYFQGHRKEFSIPLVLDGTAFQRNAWQALTKIPYGQTLSYQQQAIAVGGKNKVRAVGGANGRNPISIIVPCHRVIAKNGDLNGFGGGDAIKRFLIQHEKNSLNLSFHTDQHA